MPERTTNYGLTKPGGTDTLNIEVINTDMDSVDDLMHSAHVDLALVQNGDTATKAIPAKSFLIWKGTLYITNRVIPMAGAITLAALDAVNGGGFNNAEAIWKQEHIQLTGQIGSKETLDIELDTLIAQKMQYANETQYGGIAGYDVWDVEGERIIITCVTNEVMTIKNLRSRTETYVIDLYFRAK